jgi:hypothetical protein
MANLEVKAGWSNCYNFKLAAERLEDSMRPTQLNQCETFRNIMTIGY